MILELQNISKQYKGTTALFPMDVSVNKEECIVLCGGNGAGKSTLIKIMTGISNSSSGTIQFHSNEKKPFAYMPDQMNFPMELTSAEILHYYGKFLNVSKDRMTNVLQEVGLWDVRNQRVGGFSKGMAQRLNLAQCLLADTDLYILDEPTNGLDPYWVIQFKQILQRLRAEGKTVIISSHIMRDAIEIADKVLILFKGKMMSYGTLEDIYQEHTCSSLEEVFLKIHKQIV